MTFIEIVDFLYGKTDNIYRFVVHGILKERCFSLTSSSSNVPLLSYVKLCTNACPVTCVLLDKIWYYTLFYFICNTTIIFCVCVCFESLDALYLDKRKLTAEL